MDTADRFRRPLGSGTLHFHRQETPPRSQEIDIYVEEPPSPIRDIDPDIRETTSLSQETPARTQETPARTQETPSAAKKRPRSPEKRPRPSDS